MMNAIEESQHQEHKAKTEGNIMKKRFSHSRAPILLALVAAASLLSFSAHAALVILTASDGAGESSFNTALHWGAVPIAGNDYLVEGVIGRTTLRTPTDINNPAAFAGDSLTIGSNTATGASLIYKGGAGNGTVTVNNLKFDNGTFINNAVTTNGTSTPVTLAGNITLLAGGGKLDLTNATSLSGHEIHVTAPISGVGSLEVWNSSGTATWVGTGVSLYAVNSYTGNTTVKGTGMELNLVDNAGMKFVIGATGANNMISGNGTLHLDGDFTFDLSGAAAVGSWTIVNVSTLTETFGSTFTVNGFTGNAHVWTLGNYTFTEATGILTAVPEPAVWALLAFSLTTVIVLRRRRA